MLVMYMAVADTSNLTILTKYLPVMDWDVKASYASQNPEDEQMNVSDEIPIWCEKHMIQFSKSPCMTMKLRKEFRMQIVRWTFH